MKVITDISMEEQYTPNGTKRVLKVEDMELPNIRLWDLYALAALTKENPFHAIRHADQMVAAREERYPNDE